MADITGVNQHTNAAGTKNTIEDFGVAWRTNYQHEGIIDGMVVQASSPTSTNIEVTTGSYIIDGGDSEFLIYRLGTLESVAVPNTGTAKHYLVVAKVDLTNATETIEVIEGTAGTDPELTEGGSPEVYYLVLARIDKSATTNITDAEIVQDGVTLTNNSTPEVIGRTTKTTGWELLNVAASFVSNDTTTAADHDISVIDIQGDMSRILELGYKMKFTQSSTVKYHVVADVSVTDNVTTLTLTGDGVANEALTDIFFSYGRYPFGWDGGNPHSWKIGTDTPSLIADSANFVVNTWDIMDYDFNQLRTGTGIVDPVTITKEGVYTTKEFAVFDGNATGRRIIRTTINGTQVSEGVATILPVSGVDTRFAATSDHYLNVGDTVGMEVQQTSGGNLNVEKIRLQGYLNL